MAGMRRVWATWLLAEFAFSIIGPAVFADSETQLPGCCRRLGKHHCAATRALPREESSGPAFENIGKKCPYFPAGRVVPAHEYTWLLRATQTISVSIASHPAAPVQSEARYRVSFSRSRQKRGPPFLLS